MSLYWMFAILLGNDLFPFTRSQSTCCCNEQLKTIFAPMRVPCPKPQPSTTMFNLFKDKEVIFNVSCSLKDKSLNCPSPSGMEGVSLEIDQQNQSVSVVLSKLTDSIHGDYRCELTVIFPPPYRVQSNVTVRVIEGHRNSSCNDSGGSSPHTEPIPRSVWTWIPVVVFLSIYSIVITIIAAVNWVKLRRTESQNDYMNTKPRGPRERRKKKWSLNPIPRHF
ncbi:uncharacterized protein LOC115056726 [Echeneis naucrates]|uniref:Uncharacterized LOC115056726 n=1 Tax=Echeneis naucrates TaxID=173247 RepID=A0A665TGB2_ECHNA|nr:uncharacterized protein LOC115056726 [Echeneis naucrates]